MVNYTNLIYWLSCTHCMFRILKEVDVESKVRIWGTWHTFLMTVGWKLEWVEICCGTLYFMFVSCKVGRLINDKITIDMIIFNPQ